MEPEDRHEDSNAGAAAVLDHALSEAAIDVRDGVEFLIHHRELLRDEELDRLEREAALLTDKLRDLDRRKLLEELACFRDVLALHKRLVKGNEARR